MVTPRSKARIAGSVMCCWGWSRDPGNPACENVALPGFDLCPSHERLGNYLEATAAQCPEDWDEAKEYEQGEWEPCCLAPFTSGDPYQHEPHCKRPNPVNRMFR